MYRRARLLVVALTTLIPWSTLYLSYRFAINDPLIAVSQLGALVGALIAGVLIWWRWGKLYGATLAGLWLLCIVVVFLAASSDPFGVLMGAYVFSTVLIGASLILLFKKV